MKKILNGLNITYRYHKGQNQKTVLLLHGWGGNLNSFRFLEERLKTDGFSVITIDFPGFGGSDAPKKDFTLDDYVKIVKELLEQENVKDYSIVAHSFGGRVAIKLASINTLNQKHIEQENSGNEIVNFSLQKLVLVDSAGIKPRFDLKTKFKIWRYKFLKKLKKIGLTKKDLSDFGSDDYKAMPEELKVVFNRIVNEDLTENLKLIDCPTLLVWGKDDKDTPYYMAKKMKKSIKDSAIITFEGGHFAYLKHAEKFYNITKEFLQ